MGQRGFIGALILLFLSYCSPAVQYYYDYSSYCSRAYEQYLSLHITEGRILTAYQAYKDPYNLMANYIADYEDCIVLLINNNKEEYKQAQGHLDDRLAMLEKGDEKSPWHRLCKAGLYLHWAIINTRFGEQYSAALKFRKSFALLKENQRLFPAFEYNNVFAGLEEAVVGSLPGSYKWLASVLGMSGSVKKGTDKLAAFVATHSAKDPLYSEAVLYSLYTRFYLLADQQAVWDQLTSPQFSTKNNLMNTFVKANIGLDFRKSDMVIETLKASSVDRSYRDFAIFDYQMGMALLTRGDTLCANWFQQYLIKNQSENFIKDTWQKLAFAFYIGGNMRKADYYRNQITLQGTARLDADKQAQKFAESKVWPMRKLLQARLAIDGGYYRQAADILNAIQPATLNNAADKAEYYFRYGRVHEESADNAKALESYRQAINTGKERHEQFAARAALHMGRIYERAGRKTEALASYNECLDMPSHDFQNSIDQQAKSGVNRVEGR